MGNKKYSPDNPFAPETEKYSPDNPFVSPEITGGESFSAGTTESYGDSALAFPRFMLQQVPSAIAAGVQGVGGLVTGGDFDFSRRYRENMVTAPLQVPAPTTAEASGFARALPSAFPGGKPFGEAFKEEKMGFEQHQAAAQEANPFAFAAGGVGGDVATLMTGRAPLSKGILKAEKKYFGRPDLMFGSARTTEKATGLWNKVKGTGAARFLNDVIKSDAIKSVGRGAGRSLETGFDAAVLDMLKDDDPLETAVFAASGQLAGSAMLNAAKHFTGGKLSTAFMNITTAALASASMLQVLKDATPGGEDSIISSFETSYQKITIALMLGGLTGVMGGGRLRGDSSLVKNLPEIADALATIPRGVTLSLLEDWVNAPEPIQRDVDVILRKLAEQPDFFGPATDTLKKGLESTGFVGMVEELKQDPQFQKRLEELYEDEQ